MFWVSKVLAPAALLGAFAAGAVTLAQPPGGDGQDKKSPFEKKAFGEKKGDFKGQPGDKKSPFGSGPGGFGPGGQPPGFGRPRGPGGERTDPAVEGWLNVLVEKMNDPHDTVRDSARAGIVAIGPAALPTLRRLADGDDGAKAVAARKLIATIQQQYALGGPSIASGPGMPSPSDPSSFGPPGPGGPGGPPRGIGPGEPMAPGTPAGPPPGVGPGTPGRPGVGPGSPMNPGGPTPGPGGPGRPPGVGPGPGPGVPAGPPTPGGPTPPGGRPPRPGDR
jgi:hypothetical protein